MYKQNGLVPKATHLSELDELTTTPAESQTQQGCTTTFNGFDGVFGKSASLWLANVERRRKKDSTPSMYLQHIDRHLEGQAAQWVLNTPRVWALIRKGFVNLATESDIEAFHQALSDRFKLNDEEAQDLKTSTPLGRLAEIYQGDDEGLEHYYKRARDYLLAMHGRDDESDGLMPLEASFRAIVVESFVLGLCSRSLQLCLLRQHVFHPTRTLHEAYRMAEAQMKVMEEREKEKEQEEKAKKRKLATDDKEPANSKKQKLGMVELGRPMLRQLNSKEQKLGMVGPGRLTHLQLNPKTQKLGIVKLRPSLRLKIRSQKLKPLKRKLLAKFRTNSSKRPRIARKRLTAALLKPGLTFTRTQAIKSAHWAATPARRATPATPATTATTAAPVTPTFQSRV